jgi:transketolase C-terminal domain/subunit
MTRKLFAKLLFDEMAINEDVYLITGDLGYGLWDQIKDTYPDKFYNVGSS